MEKQIEEFLDYCGMERGDRPSTLQSYRWNLGRIVRHVNGNGLDSNTLRDWFRAELGAVSPETLRLEGRVLHIYLAWRLQSDPGAQELIDRLHGFAFPPTGKKRKQALSQEATMRLVGQPDPRTTKGLRDSCLLYLIYGCGLRIGECAGLTYEDVDAEHRLLRVPVERAKSRKERWIPIPDKAMRVLVWYIRDQERQIGRLFSIGIDGIRQMIERRAAAAGIGHVAPHKLRHAYATHLLQNGADLKTVSELLGHSSIETTEIYVDADAAACRKAVIQCHPLSDPAEEPLQAYPPALKIVRK